MPLIFLAVAMMSFAAPAFAQQSAPAPTQTKDLVTVQLPNNPVSEVASYYEMLTHKRLIRDSNLTGPNLSIVAPEPVTKEDAIEFIEAALLLNGYSLVPVDEKTSKLLGPSKQPRSESVPLYVDPSQLPAGDQVVSYFMPFHFIKNTEAATVFNSYVTVRSYGSIVPIPNINALVITENVPLVKRLISLRRVIDIEGAQITTEFFTLKRADAEKVAEILTKRLESAPQAAPAEGGQGAPGGKSEAPAAAPSISSAQEIQVIPDPRTNRVMVLAPEQEMIYIRKLVSDLDQAVVFEEPLERPLRFVAAADVLPVLANLLQEGKDANGSTTQNATNTPTTSSAPTVADSGGGGAGGGSKPDRLREPSESTAPLSVIVGKCRIVADRSANKIMVFGPPESRAKAAKVLDMLDRRPKQVYLATVIGQLTLGKGVDAGIDYLIKYGNVRIIGQGDASTINNLIANRAAGVNLTQNAANTASTAADTVTSVASSVLPIVSGLTVFGTIADSVNVYARALASTNRFKVISRPVVYTANNKKAVISSGQQVPVPESSLTSAISANANGTGTSIASNIEYKDVVLKLEVIPLINSNNEVTLTIAQQNDNIQEEVQISNNQVPVIGTQELTTTVTVPNRQTIILGGLITDEETRTQTGIPFLKDIPGLGYLFSSTKKDVTRRELIVMIQPFIIDSDETLEEANTIEKEKSGIKPEYDGDYLPVRQAEPVKPEPLGPGAKIPGWSAKRQNEWINDSGNH